MKPLRPKTPRKKPFVGDPVRVYCRVRPTQSDNDQACLTIISPNTVSIVPPESAVNYRNGNCKEIRYTFQHVFSENCSQKEVFDNVALPLVEQLVNGKNGLLFTYGVTGSGKTFTMAGNSHDGGIMPRCLDVIFNSISDNQAKKYVFKPDKMNGFEIQSDADACMDRQNDLHHQMLSWKTPKSARKKDLASLENELRIPDNTKLEDVDEDSNYAVFVTYVEIYNNNTYDLLEDADEGIRSRSLQNRILREDGNHNMYVHGVKEVEVKSTEEAFDAFYKGQKRKRMAYTTLNAESSRSHSVFTIRLVQAPLDSRGESLVTDKKAITISQLSLVDLAGSERTNRTKNSGQRLREAGNINNSLMTLRTCLEILRENQLQGTNKIIPYRDSRITHLFKNFFDGEGNVRVIVCVNPRADDYDETLQVMKFAEMTQEVQIAKPTSQKAELGFLPGRRRANQAIKEVEEQVEQVVKVNIQSHMVDLGLVYSLGPPFPPMELQGPDDDQTIKNLIEHVEQRLDKRRILIEDLAKRKEIFRNQLVEAEKQSNICKLENCNLRAQKEQDRIKIGILEKKLVNYESLVGSLQKSIKEKEENIVILQKELNGVSEQLHQHASNVERNKQKLNNKIISHTERVAREMEQKMKIQRAEYKNQIRSKTEKLRKVRKILSDEDISSIASAHSDSSLNKITAPSSTPLSSGMKPVTPFTAQSRSTHVASSRRRRSRSASGEVWVDHRPGIPVELGTVLQPQMKRRKSVTKLTDAKTITNSKTSKYCLMTQEQDTDGELETRLYKADVVPTSGGGAQVIFNDVETLKQQSPTSSPIRKRSASNPDRDVEGLCAVSIEGHGKKPRL